MIDIDKEDKIKRKFVPARQSSLYRNIIKKSFKCHVFRRIGDIMVCELSINRIFIIKIILPVKMYSIF